MYNCVFIGTEDDAAPYLTPIVNGFTPLYTCGLRFSSRRIRPLLSHPLTPLSKLPLLPGCGKESERPKGDGSAGRQQGSVEGRGSNDGSPCSVKNYNGRRTKLVCRSSAVVAGYRYMLLYVFGSQAGTMRYTTNYAEFNSQSPMRESFLLVRV